MARTLFLIRAMAADPVSLHLAEVLSASVGRSVVFVCDETNGPADAGGYPKISMTPAALRAMGFRDAPGNWGWLWGDMCYHAARAQFPSFDAYCLMESDVFVPDLAAPALVSALMEHEADVIAGRLRRYETVQKFSRPLEALGLDPHWGCIFPLTRLSARAVSAMGELRRAAIAAGVAGKLNDEGVLVGAMQQAGLTGAALEDVVPEMVSPLTFETNPPHLFDALVARDSETRVFHPVVMRDVVLRRIESGEKNYNRHRLRRVLKQAAPDDRAMIETALKKAAS